MANLKIIKEHDTLPSAVTGGDAVTRAVIGAVTKLATDGQLLGRTSGIDLRWEVGLPGRATLDIYLNPEEIDAAGEVDRADRNVVVPDFQP